MIAALKIISIPKSNNLRRPKESHPFCHRIYMWQNQSMNKKIHWRLEGRESLELDFFIENNEIHLRSFHAVGCLNFLRLSNKMKELFPIHIESLKPPLGSDHTHLIWQEVIATLKDQWSPPIQDEELCHCRKINTDVVDYSIVYGAHDIETIRKRTSANTGCGTCKSNVLQLLDNRLGTQ